MHVGICPWAACTLVAAASVSSWATPTEWLDPASAEAATDGKVLWYDVLNLGLEGRGWADTATPYDRLPATAEAKVPAAVWGLSLNSAGMCVRFVTDATTLQAHWVLRSATLGMNHMPATGVSGLDLYVRTPDRGWRWVAVGRPESTDVTTTLIGDMPPGEREFLLYLPLYNGVSSVKVGVPAGARLGKAPARNPGRSRPLVFYGTSITQGGCASRPGMVHTAILGRRLDLPVINLGFSGAGRMEPALAELLAQLDPAVYVLDCLPNMGAAEVTERLEPFVRILRQAHPDTPILMVEDRTYANAFISAGARAHNETSRAAHKAAYERLQAAGVIGLHYLAGDGLLGADGEDTVDGSHPTDLGFMRQAAAMEPALRPLLGGGGH
jgi:lysophospholipase L1-like esterase